MKRYITPSVNVTLIDGEMILAASARLNHFATDEWGNARSRWSSSSFDEEEEDDEEEE